jgi:hypothetical protein
VDQVVVEDVVRQWDAHAPDEMIDHPVVVHVDVRHLVIPFLVVWVKDERIDREYGRRLLRDFEQVHDLVDRLIAAVAWAAEDWHPCLFVPQPEELDCSLVAVHFCCVCACGMKSLDYFLRWAVAVAAVVDLGLMLNVVVARPLAAVGLASLRVAVAVATPDLPGLFFSSSAYVSSPSIVSASRTGECTSDIAPCFTRRLVLAIVIFPNSWRVGGVRDDRMLNALSENELWRFWNCVFGVVALRRELVGALS